MNSTLLFHTEAAATIYVHYNAKNFSVKYAEVRVLRAFSPFSITWWLISRCLRFLPLSFIKAALPYRVQQRRGGHPVRSRGLAGLDRVFAATCETQRPGRRGSLIRRSCLSREVAPPPWSARVCAGPRLKIRLKGLSLAILHS